MTPLTLSISVTFYGHSMLPGVVLAHTTDNFLFSPIPFLPPPHLRDEKGILGTQNIEFVHKISPTAYNNLLTSNLYIRVTFNPNPSNPSH